MQVVLICNGGMSSSLLMSRMKDAALKANLAWHFFALPLNEIHDMDHGVDIILLAPQVRYEMPKLKVRFPDKVLMQIEMMDYGIVNGEAVFQKILKEIEDV